MSDRSPDLLRSTVIAGVLFGVIGSLPFVGLLNCACCALVLGCGFFAAYLYAGKCRGEGAPFGPAAGATAGLVAGAFYALTTAVVATAIHAAIGDPGAKMLLEWLAGLRWLPEENRQTIEEALRQMEESRPSLGGFVLEFFWWVLLGAIFSTLGGLLGGTVFRTSKRNDPNGLEDAGSR